MMVRERLRQLKTLRCKIEHIKQEEERIRTLAIGLSAIRYDKDKVQTSNIPDFTDNCNDHLEILEKLANERHDLEEEVSEVAKKVRKLNGNEYIAVYERYIKGRSVNDIADDFNGKEVTPEWIKRLIARGIRHLEEYE